MSAGDQLLRFLLKQCWGERQEAVGCKLVHLPGYCPPSNYPSVRVLSGINGGLVLFGLL